MRKTYIAPLTHHSENSNKHKREDFFEIQMFKFESSIEFLYKRVFTCTDW